MRRWLIVMLGIAMPTMAANIKGTVTSADGRKLTKARVILLHDLVAPLAQRTSTDFNGLYKLQLDPGPYRLLILKRGFRPEMKRILVLSERESIDLVHVLEVSGNGDQKAQDERNKDMLKTMLRRNQHRDPLRSVVMEVGYTPQMAAAPEHFLVGSMSTSSHRRLNGEMAKHAEVALQTQINEAVSLRSSLKQEVGDATGTEARHLKADLGMEVDNIRLRLGGESLSGLGDDFTHLGQVRAHLGETYKGETEIQFLESQVEGVDQNEYLAAQSLEYELGGHQLLHEFEYQGWRHLDDDFAERVSIATAWQPAFSKSLSLAVEHQDLHVADEGLDLSRLWLGWNKTFNDAFSVDSKMGYLWRDATDLWVHEHRLVARQSTWSVSATYKRDQAFQSYRQHDIYGIHGQQHLTPYMTESFYLKEEERLSLDMGLEHGYSLYSGFMAERLRDQASFLYSHNSSSYRGDASRELERFVYLLTSRNWGASIELGLARHESDDYTFSQEQMAFKQNLSPFRNKALGMQLELRVQRRPELPGWWLLSEMPMELDSDGRWYEGRLGVQF